METDLYSDHYRYKVTESDFSHRLCGAHRPGHFDGVLTVVLKLLNLAQADKAYLEKRFSAILACEGNGGEFFLKDGNCPLRDHTP